jgi:predicted nuclease of restriction endonuclease-like RecB superfamily
MRYFEDDINENNNSTQCLICNAEANGYHFCKECYYKYKNKELILSIIDCKTIKILKENYINNYRCIDGHWVKSKAEREIDNYFFTHNIPHIYEKPIPIGMEKSDIIHPDFCLPNYLGQDKDVYIEHWGYENEEYLQQQKYKLEQYKKLHLTVICTYENEDSADIETTLMQKLNKQFIKEGEINYEK